MKSGIYRRITRTCSRSADRPAHLGCSAKRSKSHLRRGWPAAIKQVALRSARVPLGVTRATRLFFFPPELLEALGPAAVVLVQPVADRVLLVEVLVVLLGRIELRGGHDLGDDRPFERLGLHQRLLRFLGEPLLRRVVVEDGRTILVPSVAA